MKHSESFKLSLIEKIIVNTFTPLETILGSTIGKYFIPELKQAKIKEILSDTYKSKVNNYKGLLISMDIHGKLMSHMFDMYKSTPCGCMCLIAVYSCRDVKR